MTSPEPETPEQSEETAQPEEARLYRISFERLAELKRSAVLLLAERRPPSCPSLQKPDQELSDPQELLDEIAQYSGDEEGFIHINMTIQEILFRTLLARRNQPTTLHDLHYELTERWSTPIRPISVTEDGLRRILEADGYYGFASISPEEAEALRRPRARRRSARRSA